LKLPQVPKLKTFEITSHDKMFQRAIKTFNLAQMRKGGTLYHANHCYDLVSLALNRI